MERKQLTTFTVVFVPEIGNMTAVWCDGVLCVRRGKVTADEEWMLCAMVLSAIKAVGAC